jgi:predicted transcriptional regulator of viral defense system
MESAVMGWVEAERRTAVTIDEVADTFPWDRQAVRYALSRLALKGWLRRTANGRYETIPAETGGFAPPNPWSALSTWGQRHYVAFQSAAFELGLTPDRPGDVQIAVAVGARRPLAWENVPVELIHLRAFSPDATERRELHGWSIVIANLEKVVSDSALLPGRVGGVRGLVRIVDRARETVEWSEVVRLTEPHPSGPATLRRLAALLDVIGEPVPQSLARAAAPKGKRVRQILLGDPAFDGNDGAVLLPWNVIGNVFADDLREELRR